MFSDELAYVGKADAKSTRRVSPPSSGKFSPRLATKGGGNRSKTATSDATIAEKGEGGSQVFLARSEVHFDHAGFKTVPPLFLI